MQVRVAAALSRIAAQEEQSFDGGEERVHNWDKARREKERKEEGEELLCPCSVIAAPSETYASEVKVETLGRAQYQQRTK